MAYYKPKYLAVIGVIASVLISLSLPMFGYILSRMVFTLMKKYPNMDEYIAAKNEWIMYFVILVVFIFVFTFL